MKYRDLISFEPITSVVKLVESGSDRAAETIAKTFVFSRKIKEDLCEAVLKNLDPNPSTETRGVQIVGSYGTGKSHLMALVAAIAEDAQRVHFLSDPEMKAAFADIAGRYKVLRFEIGTDKSLKDILFAQIERFLEKEKVDYCFNENSNFSWKEQIGEMMAAFEAAFPNKHFLIVIDEMLEYLKGRDPTALANDLMLLRQVGEACDNSRFKIMFGVQELLYRAPEFQFAAEMLNKVEDRFADLIITKDDVAYVVKERLLKKNEHQKKQIREHLLAFAPLFDGINTNLNEYVDLFPVHPSYVGHFERIKQGKSQREILKVLSARFMAFMDTEVPTDKPGLITYDTYWEDLSATPSMITLPDIRTVKDKIDIVYDRIDSHFIQGRASRKGLARQIANALAIRILSDDLDKRNGANAVNLKEDLCQTISGAAEPELLVQAIESIANQLKTATAGQYIDQDTVSGQFYLRTEGGINIQQIIRDYADTVLKRNEEQADQYWFEFLQYVLGLQQNTYRTGFKIWQHSLEWIDKKSFRLGYIFFGNPNERSTTEPIQQYYIFFCPLFSAISRNDEADEVYFEMKGFSQEFKERVLLYGAAKALEANASSDQKALFRSQIEEHRKRILELFEREFVEKTTVIYKGTETLLKVYQLPGDGAGKDAIFSAVSAKVLNKQFSDKYADYPTFSDLLSPLSKDNFDLRIKSALKKIISFSQANRDGEAILAGLGLINGASIDTRNSRYADSIRKLLQSRGPGKVLNRDEILYPHYIAQNLWYSKDFKLDYQLEFVVLSAMVYKGDIEIIWPGSRSLSATNIDQELLRLSDDDYSSFQSIREPVGLPIKEIKALFGHLGIPDLSAELEKADTLARILTEAKKRAERVARIKSELSKGLRCRNVELLDSVEAARISEALEKLVSVLDGIQGYDTFGKLKSFRYKEEELNNAFSGWKYCDLIEKLIQRGSRFETLVGYLSTALSYVVASEKPLYDDMETAIADLSNVLKTGKDTEYTKYESLLKSLVDRYAEYYLTQYLKCRLSHADSMQKDSLLASKTKQTCDVIKDVEFISRTEYENWVNRISSLKEADHSLTKARVIEEPYHGFNPREFYDKPSYTIRDLKEQLENILERWVGSMQSIFKDPSIKSNLEVLDANSRNIVEAFRDNKIKLDPDNAPKLRRLLSDLSKGFEKVELSPADFSKIFNKPMTIEEARESFDRFLANASAGKERVKVRIVFTEGKFNAQ
jgi:hypothetical protein